MRDVHVLGLVHDYLQDCLRRTPGATCYAITMIMARTASDIWVDFLCALKQPDVSTLVGIIVNWRAWCDEVKSYFERSVR